MKLLPDFLAHQIALEFLTSNLLDKLVLVAILDGRFF
jgi:hypothetical protein